MTRFFIFILAILLPFTAIAQELDFTIVNTNEREAYNSTAFRQELENRHGFAVAGAILMLVETPALEDVRFETQKRILGNLAYEEKNYELFRVISCAEKEYRDGYFTSLEEARRLNPDREFKVTLLTMEGTVLYEKLGPVNGRIVRGFIQRVKRNL